MIARPPFASPAAALTWLEWRSNLYLLPFLGLALLVLAPLALMIYLAGDLHMLALQLPALALYPLMMAMVGGAGLGTCHAWARHQPAIPAFLAARPVTSGTILAVKLRAAVLIVLVTWALLVLVIAGVLPLSATGEQALDSVRQLFDSQGSVRGTAWLVLAALGLPAFSWKLTIDQFWIGLHGRHWANSVMGLGIPVVVTLLAVLGTAIYHSPWLREHLLAAAPWIVAAALGLKLALGGLVAKGCAPRVDHAAHGHMLCRRLGPVGSRPDRAGSGWCRRMWRRRCSSAWRPWCSCCRWCAWGWRHWPSTGTAIADRRRHRISGAMNITVTTCRCTPGLRGWCRRRATACWSSTPGSRRSATTAISMTRLAGTGTG